MILITGAARSGTSLVTSILQGIGAYLGAPEDINALYENTAIREGVLKPYLNAMGCDPMGQDVLPPLGTELPDLPAHASLFFLSQGRRAAYKDAKLALTWSAWHRAFPEAKWVIVRREPDQIVRSCLNTSFMRKRTTRADWLTWVSYHEQQFGRMKQAGLDVVEVWPAEVMDAAEAFRPVADHCGLAFDPAVVRAAIDPERFKRN